jgi:membrane fusion protein (multidrug efflux system)
MQAMQNNNVTPLTVVAETPQQKRKRLLTILALVVALGGIVSYTYWKLVASKHVSTDNAYAAADIAFVTPSTGGTVKAILAVDTQRVKAGESLVILDDTDAKIALLEAEANAARAQTDFERAQTNFNRRQKLAVSGYVSAEELNNSESALKVGKANADSARASLEQARLDLSRTVIRAPIDGIVAKRDVQLGQRIAAGAHLLSIIPVSQIYVNANFKEVQLRHVKIGQPVEVHADIYGSSVTYHGRVAGVSGGTGSAFAIIPAQNATGNWIKVVQRLPVRIQLDRETLLRHPLQVGLSMHADIYIGATNP